METLRRRSLPFSDRLLALFSPPQPSTGVGDELNEDDVFYAGFGSISPRTDPIILPCLQGRAFGILAALSDDAGNGDAKATVFATSSTRAIPMSISKPKPKPAVYQNSVPISIPAWRRTAKVNDGASYKEEEEEEEEEEGEMVPPHMMVARASSPTTVSFSVLEGVGRTLKGRDLRRVRNAVLQKTGFLD
ncbi:uncharacterized protein [Typha angustifolia]|uniref:uncharacterized protein n=1 Tax=Typha angustifolia TaxID=59011 RepID=UPI003C2EF116